MKRASCDDALKKRALSVIVRYKEGTPCDRKYQEGPFL
jgi:hypothetical protein